MRLTALAAALFLPVAGFAAEIGDDGLHKAGWMRDTFKDLRDDLAEATADGRRLMVLVEQRGCIYCRQMHEEVFPDPAVLERLEQDYFVIQINMFGDIEVVDFDGEALSEKEAVRKWGLLFTPTMMFFPEEVAEVPAHEAAVAVMPGAFRVGTTRDLLSWVVESGYETDESFQKYHARMIAERNQ